MESASFLPELSPAPKMSFDALAPHYRWMEWLLAGEKLQRCRTTFLDQVKSSKHVLIAGEGNGRFLAALKNELTEAEITCVDSSLPMLLQAQSRIERFGLKPEGINFVNADVLEWRAPTAQFDLIVSHFFLDCFPADQLGRVVEKLSRAATGDAAWLLADFQVPANGPWRLRALMIHRLMYGFFRFATRLPAKSLTPPDMFLEEQGFELKKRSVTELGLLHSDLWKRKQEMSAG